MVKSMVLGLCGMVAAGAALGQTVPIETAKLSGRVVTLHVQPFLEPAELAALRLVTTNKDALQIFVTSDKGFSAMAVSPNEGFIRKGELITSAQAVGNLPDAPAAAKAAVATCDAARKKSSKPCVIVLEVAPAK